MVNFLRIVSKATKILPAEVGALTILLALSVLLQFSYKK